MSSSLPEKQQPFDLKARSWDEDPKRVQLAHAVADAIRSAVPLSSGMQVLDFGCGTGLVTLQIQPQVGSITGVDTSSGMLNVLKEKIIQNRIANVQVLLLNPGDAVQFDRRYDLIVSSMALHHIRDYTQLLHVFAQSLLPGGCCALADLDCENGQFHSSSEGVFHHGFDRAVMARGLAAAGFVDISAVTAARIVKPVAGATQEFSVFLITAKMP